MSITTTKSVESEWDSEEDESPTARLDRALTNEDVVSDRAVEKMRQLEKRMTDPPPPFPHH